MKVGILGGTFDPIHIGHLIVAEEARYQLGLGRVIFLPAGKPYFKKDRIVSTKNDRLEMIRLGIKDNPLFEVSEIELAREGPTYSIDSIKRLKKELGDNVQLCFLIGMDALADMHKWKHPAELIEICQVVGLTRAEYDAFDWAKIEGKMPGAMQKIKIIEVSKIGVSSTDVRMMVASGISVRYLVPDAVVRYIEEHKLYKSGDL
jgi:nicotinate-nucleotide adenylyltransferase